jgi:hypothetical protein
MHAMYLRKRYGVCGLRAFRCWFGGKFRIRELLWRESRSLFPGHFQENEQRKREKAG